jgi:hypothetical protein
VRVPFFITSAVLTACRTTRLSLLDAAMSVLTCGPPTHDPQVLARLAKTALPPISGVASQAPRQEESALAAQSRKGKKRVRAYEGEEVLGAAAGALCAGARDGAVLERAVQRTPAHPRVRPACADAR